jgi:hypothetical protein
MLRKKRTSQDKAEAALFCIVLDLLAYYFYPGRPTKGGEDVGKESRQVKWPDLQGWIYRP